MLLLMVFRKLKNPNGISPNTGSAKKRRKMDLRTTILKAEKAANKDVSFADETETLLYPIS